MIRIISAVLKVFALVLLLAVGALAVTIGYSSDCPAPSADATTNAMRAALNECYGSPDVIRVAQVEKPSPGENEVLVKVEAAGVNPLDWHYLRGSPYLMRLSSGIGAPSDARMGVDFAGVVEAVGANVTRYTVGDTVFGAGSGAFADYLVVREDRAMAQMPANTTFAEAAAVPIAGISALQALRDLGQLQAGQHVLINGASGGVGTFAIQIAKAMGATVTGVCSDRNIELVTSLGADHVINYKTTNYTQQEPRYDLIVDNIGNHGVLSNAGVLKPTGRLVAVGGAPGDWIGPFAGPLSILILAPFIEQDATSLMARLKVDDLQSLAELMQEGSLKSVVDRSYPLADIDKAIAYSESGRARGKIIVTVE